MVSVLVEFRINALRLGYFVLDNAHNNNTAIAALAGEFNFNPKHRRLRCIGYILSRVVKQLIFGATANAMETEYDADFDFNTASNELKKWRKKRPVRRLYDFVSANLAILIS